MISIPTPVSLKINEFHTLEALLKEFPIMIREWRAKVLKQIEDDVKVMAEGDDIIEENLFSQ